MSWWTWVHDVRGTKPIFVRAMMFGRGGRSKEEIKSVIEQDSLSAREFYGELAFILGTKADLPRGIRDFLADSFEKISHGEDACDALGLRRKKGDKRTPEEQIWALHCVIETLCFDYKLSEHKAHCLMADYFGMESESIYRKTKKKMLSQVARTMLERGETIAFGPGIDDLVNLIPSLFPNHRS